MTDRTLKICSEYFLDIICHDQNLLVQKHAQQLIFDNVETFNKDFAAELKKLWSKMMIQGTDSFQLWNELVRLQRQFASEETKKKKGDRSIS